MTGLPWVASAPRSPLRLAGRVSQTLTHRELRVDVYTADAPPAGLASTADLRWVRPQPARLGALGLSSLARKCLTLVVPALANPRT